MLARLIFATVLSTILVFISPTRWGALSSFLYSFPLVVFCVGYIGQEKDARKAAALGFLIPAVGYASWKYAIASLDMEYLALQQGAAHALRLLQYSVEGTSTLIGGAAIAAWILAARKMAIFLGMIAILTLGNRYLLLHACKEIDRGDPLLAANLTLLPEIIRWIPVMILPAFLKNENRQDKWLFGIGALLGLWITTPLIWFHLSQLDVGKAHPHAPHGEPGLGVAFPSADPSSPHFSTQLNSQGSHHLQGKGWWCDPQTRPNWKKKYKSNSGIACKKKHDSCPVEARIA